MGYEAKQGYIHVSITSLFNFQEFLKVEVGVGVGGVYRFVGRPDFCKSSFKQRQNFRFCYLAQIVFSPVSDLI